MTTRPDPGHAPLAALAAMASVAATNVATGDPDELVVSRLACPVLPGEQNDDGVRAIASIDVLRYLVENYDTTHGNADCQTITLAGVEAQVYFSEVRPGTVSVQILTEEAEPGQRVRVMLNDGDLFDGDPNAGNDAPDEDTGLVETWPNHNDPEDRWCRWSNTAYDGKVRRCPTGCPDSIRSDVTL